MHRPVLVTPPDRLPLDLDQVKLHLRIEPEDSDEDDLVDGLLQAAVSHLDGWSGVLGRCLVSQTWRQDFDRFDRCMRLPMLAVSVATVRWRNAAGEIATIAGANYALLADELGSYVRFSNSYSLPADLAQSQAASIEFVTGYGEPEDVPAAIRQAILLLVGHWYSNRDAVVTGTIATPLPFAVDALVAPFRRVGI